MEYINKSALVAEIEKYYNECLKRAKIIDSDYWNTKADAYRNVLVILDNTLEIKEVDLEKEVHSQMDLLCNLLYYMVELSNGDSEGVYPLPTNVIEDLQKFAKHFYELGLKAQKGE